MQTEKQTTESQPIPPAPGIIMCTVDGCPNAAVASYAWDWGETGYCCQHHTMILRQTAGNLGRSVTFAPIMTAPEPLNRDERVRLHAERLTAEDESREAKMRTAQVLDQNTALTAELRRLTLISNEREAQLRDAAFSLRSLQEERDQLLAKVSDLKDENIRLRQLNDALEGAQALEQEGKR